MGELVPGRLVRRGAHDTAVAAGSDHVLVLLTDGERVLLAVDAEFVQVRVDAQFGHATPLRACQ
jgi:hypothetical protein